MAVARTRLGEDYRVVALLGDGSLTGGLAYEGLSMAGQSGEPMVVILNDNGMSIDASMGGVAQHLAKQRLKPQYLRGKEIYRKAYAGHARRGGPSTRGSTASRRGSRPACCPAACLRTWGFSTWARWTATT